MYVLKMIVCRIWSRDNWLGVYFFLYVYIVYVCLFFVISGQFCSIMSKGKGNEIMVWSVISRPNSTHKKHNCYTEFIVFVHHFVCLCVCCDLIFTNLIIVKMAYFHSLSMISPFLIAWLNELSNCARCWSRCVCVCLCVWAKIYGIIIKYGKFNLG